jgi:hypothetical protein
MNFKKTGLFIEFPFIGQDYKICWARKLVFLFKILILPPLGLCCLKLPHHLPRAGYALGDIKPVISGLIICPECLYKRCVCSMRHLCSANGLHCYLQASCSQAVVEYYSEMKCMCVSFILLDLLQIFIILLICLIYTPIGYQKVKWLKQEAGNAC